MEASLGIGAAATATNFANKAADQAIKVSKLSAGRYHEFITEGVQITPAIMQTPQAPSLIAEIQAGSPSLSAQRVEDIAATYIQSRQSLPQVGMASSGAILVKVHQKVKLYRQTQASG